MRGWDVDMVVRFAERGIGGDPLQTLHNKFPSTGASQTCKCKEELKVTIAVAVKVLTWEVLKTGSHTTACLEAGLVY